jgi:cytochrome P460
MVFVVLATLGSAAFAAQDRYTLKLGELAFSDFGGYENWKVVAVSQTETLLKVIVANDVMMDAYRQGLPADGKLFPEGSKIVKIEWTVKKKTLWPRIS